jgi:hypothetical protein
MQMDQMMPLHTAGLQHAQHSEVHAQIGVDVIEIRGMSPSSAMQACSALPNLALVPNSLPVTVPSSNTFRKKESQVPLHWVLEFHAQSNHPSQIGLGGRSAQPQSH